MRTFSLLLMCLAGSPLLRPGVAQAAGLNFGAPSVGASATTAVTVSIPTAGKLGAIAVLTQGAPGLDFTNAGGGTCAQGTAYPANSSCTVKVTFKPRYPGIRYGAVVLSDTTGDRMAVAYIDGSGQGAQPGFLPGLPSTVMFNSQTFPEHVAVDANGNVFLIDSLNNSNSLVKETLSAAGYTQSAFGSGLVSPNGVAVDGAGDVYIADTYEFRIVKEALSSSGYVQSIAVSIPPATYPSEPYGIAIDGSGDLYITDVSNKRVLKETLTAGAYTQSVVPTSGLNASYGIAVDGSGNVYIADTFNNRVVEEALTGTSYTQSTVASGLSYPYGVAVDGSGSLYIADTLNSRVLRQPASGNNSSSQTTVGSGLTFPYGVAVDASGNVFIADSGNHRALKENFEVGPSLSFAATKEGATSSDSPQTVTVSNFGNITLKFLSVTYPADFPQNNSASSDCTASTSLGAGENCNLTIDFSPVTPSNSAGSVVLNENVTFDTGALNATSSPQQIPVSGTEILPTPIAASPAFSLATGTYNAQQSVTLTSATKNALIYYTINGATPTTASTKYTGPIVVSQTTTIKAIAITSGYTNSAVAAAAYTINIPAATPAVSLKAGTYSGSQTVTITDATPGAVIYYTANGAAATSASTKYTGPITVIQTTTVNAVAVASGYTNSAAASVSYTIMLPAATPVISLKAGTYSGPQTVTITDATPAAVIYYTANGVAPTSASSKYSGAIKVSTTQTIQAIAVASGYSNSAPVSATYTIH